MKKFTTCVLVLMTIIMSGCKVETKKSPYLCETVDNEPIDGSIGTRDVFRINLGYGIDIGYSHRGVLVPHSECAPARVTFAGNETLFEYFEFGQPSEVDGVLSINFSTSNYGKQLFYVEREDRTGRAAQEWGERNFDRDDTGRVTKKTWLSEFPFSEITSEKDHLESGVTQAVATLGSATKTVRYNANTTLYDCSYSNNLKNEFDRSCENEETLDYEFLGQAIDLTTYIDALNGRPRYETEPRELCEDVNRYEPDDGTCEEY